jgi:diguanylate cyclase (GGDEF)-like protein/PAS domain S-box-containing protein
MKSVQNLLRLWSKIGAISIGLGLVGAIVYLVFAQYRSQVALQKTAMKQVTYDSERRASTLGYFFSEQRDYLTDLAECSELTGYFENKALGMSMEYGLQASVLIVTERFDHVRQTKKLGGLPIYQRIAFIDASGRLLSDSRAPGKNWSEEHNRPIFASGKSAGPAILCDREDGELRLVISTPRFFKGRYVGRLLGWVSFEDIYRHFIEWKSESSRFPDVIVFENKYLHIPPTAKRLLPAGSASLPADIRPGVPYPFRLQGRNSFENVAYAILVPVKDSSFALMTFIPPTEQFDFRSPRQLLYTTGGLALFIIVGSFLLVRLNTRNALLKGHLEETLVREHAVDQKNRELAAEIAVRQAAENSLQKERDFIQSLFETAQVIMLVLDNQGQIERFNPFLEEISGHQLDEVRGRDWFSVFLPQEEAERRRQDFQATINNYTARYTIYSIVTRDGQRLEIEWQEKTLLDARGRLVGLLSIGQDITERSQAEAHIRKLSHGIENSATAVLITDLSGRIEYVNAKFTDVTGFSSEEAIGRNPRILQSELTPLSVFSDLWTTILNGDVWRGELQNRRKNGEVYWSYASISPLRDDQGEITHFIGNLEDINDRKNAETTIEKLAYYDPLTGLPNRRLLQDRLLLAMKRSHRQGSSVALLYLDLDRFKTINDSLGHHAGDLLLLQMAQRFMGLLRNDDIVCRLGGDEFAIILHDIARNEFAAQVAEKLIAVAGAPVVINEAEVVVTVSIGIALYPKDADDGEVLAKHADIALYQAKAEGKNTYRFYADEQNEAFHDRLGIEGALRHALSSGELALHYQPKVCLTRKKTIGVEALLRWNSAKYGAMSPLSFIQLAEETRLIIPIGEWVLRTACLQQVQWLQQGLDLDIAVNLSAVQFNHPSLIEVIAAIIAETGIRPERLELELTESALVGNPESAAKILVQLRKLGVGIAIDDFGTGYSSLSYLKTFPVNVLKIDRSFVMDLAHNAGDRAIARSIVDLAGNLGMKTVAEGVETVEQSDILTEIGCDYLQGFLYAKPVPAAELPALVEEIIDNFRKPGELAAAPSGTFLTCGEKNLRRENTIFAS